MHSVNFPYHKSTKINPNVKIFFCEWSVIQNWIAFYELMRWEKLWFNILGLWFNNKKGKYVPSCYDKSIQYCTNLFLELKFMSTYDLLIHIYFSGLIPRYWAMQKLFGFDVTAHFWNTICSRAEKSIFSYWRPASYTGQKSSYILG